MLVHYALSKNLDECERILEKMEQRSQARIRASEVFEVFALLGLAKFGNRLELLPRDKKPRVTERIATAIGRLKAQVDRNEQGVRGGLSRSIRRDSTKSERGLRDLVRRTKEGTVALWPGYTEMEEDFLSRLDRIAYALKLASDLDLHVDDATMGIWKDLQSQLGVDLPVVYRALVDGGDFVEALPGGYPAFLWWYFVEPTPKGAS